MKKLDQASLNNTNDVRGQPSLNFLLFDYFNRQVGTYMVRGSAPNYQGNRHQIRLLNVTDGTVDLVGTSEYANPSGAGYTRSTVLGQLSLSVSKTFRLEHRVNASTSTNGQGVESNFGIPEVYAVIEVTKIQ